MNDYTPEPVMARRARWSLAVALVAVSALDAVTTWAALTAQTGREANPIARAAIGVAGLGAPLAARVILGAVVAAVILRLTVLAEDTTQRVVIWSFAVAAVAWWGWIAVSNLRYL